LAPFGILCQEKSGNPDGYQLPMHLFKKLDPKNRFGLQPETGFWYASIVLESDAGLPDGLFSNPKIPILVNCGGLCNGRS
jgi:hypothetical protein